MICARSKWLKHSKSHVQQAFEARTLARSRARLNFAVTAMREIGLDLFPANLNGFLTP